MENIPTHKARVRAYSILSRIFIPLGIVCLCLGVVITAVSVPFFVQAILAAPNSQDCVVTASSIRCNGALGAQIVWSALGMSLGLAHLVFGIPLMIVGPIFRVKAKQNRALDEQAGIDYGDFPYGK